jgi:hypothetical protein
MAGGGRNEKKRKENEKKKANPKGKRGFIWVSH